MGTESGLRSGLLAASVTLSMAATCGLQNCGDAGYEAGAGCYLWTIWFWLDSKFESNSYDLEIEFKI